VPGLAGFFSKDEILFETFRHGHQILWVVGVLTSLLTATYMFRLVFLTFHGEERFHGVLAAAPGTPHPAPGTPHPAPRTPHPASRTAPSTTPEAPHEEHGPRNQELELRGAQPVRP
jgi:NADH:ubiquinone oxidoreductase subunit 5 (subunit L)/multisubunit Na+/H+ antiporter MnhA subunit